MPAEVSNKMPDRMPSPLASVLKHIYNNVEIAREAVEHRIASIPKQERIVGEWKSDLDGMARRMYPGLAVDSYPVQTRFSREVAQLNRYHEELPQRLGDYARSLKRVKEITAQTEVLRHSWPLKNPMETPPKTPGFLLKNRWPKAWPMSEVEAIAVPPEAAPVFDYPADVTFSHRDPIPTNFSIKLDSHTIALSTRYEDGIKQFTIELNYLLRGSSPSRWIAISLAVLFDIRWPALENHLACCTDPWLPRFFVDETFGLRGDLSRREDLSDFYSRLNMDAAMWYMKTTPGCQGVKSLETLLDVDIGQLVKSGLVKFAPILPVHELLSFLSHAEVKLLFTLAGLPAPRSHQVALERYPELLSARGEKYLHDHLTTLIGPEWLLRVNEVPGFSREQRLGPRARANLMVSSLIALNDEDHGAQIILDYE